MSNKRLLPGDTISQQEARKLFKTQPEPEPDDDMPPLLPPTFQSTPTFEFSVSTTDVPPLLPPRLEPTVEYNVCSTIKNKDAGHSDGPCELWKAKLAQDTYVCGSGGEQKPSHP